MDAYDRLPLDEKLLGDFLSLPAERQRCLRAKILRLSLARALTYQTHPGVTEAMNLIPLPAVLPLRRAGYLARLCAEIINIVKRVVPLYLDSDAIRETLPLLPREEQWMRDCWHPTHALRQPIIYRLDADMPLASREPVPRVRFFESNSVAVGGMFYAPVAESIIADASLRELYAGRDIPGLRRNDDTRSIIRAKLIAHAGALGRRRCTVALVENKAWDTGITEIPSLAAFLRRSGVAAFHADPRDLRISRGEITYRGRIIDVIYRNVELRDLLALEDQGAGLDALKEAFRRNQVVSSLSGEFDHKSLWELFTSKRFAGIFTARQRALLRRHIPWTRLLYERTTTDPAGRSVDLPRFVADARERLVIKPNRHCGGEGVALGPETEQREWERLIERALAEPREWVVQEWIDNTMKLLPWFAGEEGYRAAPLYTTYGFIATPQGFGAVGRACTRRVVNVASGGALLTVFLLKA